MQTAGNSLETKVLEMQDTQTLVRVDHEDKFKAYREILQEHTDEISQLQQDILD